MIDNATLENLRNLAMAVRGYFDASDANQPPQTRQEFEIACIRVQYARTHLRHELEQYEASVGNENEETGD